MVFNVSDKMMDGIVITHINTVLLLLSILFSGGANGQSSCIGQTLGNQAQGASFVTTSSDFRFLVSTDLVRCHGQINSFDFYVRFSYNCHNLEFQIWRPVDVAAGRYTMIGSNTYRRPGLPCYAGVRTLNPPTIDEIPVQPGDVYGWTDTGRSGVSQRMLTFDSAPTGSGTFEITHVLNSGDCTTGIGASCNWLQRRSDVRRYGLELNLAARPNPYFANLPITTPTRPMTPLYENSPAGTFVYRVRGLNGFSYANVIDPELTYSLVAGGTCPLNLFTIDSVTGIITKTSAVLLSFEDYDTAIPCPCTSTCTLPVRVSEGPFTGTVNLPIDILNVNEAHTITSLPAQETVDADAAGVNYLIHDVKVTDIDADTVVTTNEVLYKIVYSIPPNAPVNPVAGRIQTSQDLDHWNGPTRYVLGIVASDAIYSDGPKELTFVITNLRTNPIITNVDHTVTVPENSVNGGTLVFDVDGVSQPADGRGDPIAFFITNIYPKNTSVNTFVINSATGVVTHTVNPGFDYFGTRMYAIELEIRDSLPNRHISDRTNLSVEITWVNQPPVHTATGFTTTIDELVPIGTVLPNVLLEATDRDIPIGDWIGYLISGTGSHLFYANNMTNLVYTLDDIIVTPGSTQVVYNLNVLVFDSHGESASIPLVITVLDINDHAPVFNPVSYAGTISETAAGGTATGVTLAATDQDGGANAQIRYFIVEPLGQLYFQIDTAGVVTNKQPIPYDVYQNITFTVLAVDQGSPSLNNTALVNIEITESNTNEPFFNPKFDSMDLRSDAPLKLIVYNVTATDADTSEVQNITYYWLTLQDYFGIDGNSGGVSPSREVRPFAKYLLYIAAQDNGQPTDYYSDQFTLRIDTYRPESTLIDIHLKMPLEEFEPTKDEFMAQLDKAMTPFDMRLESYRLKGGDTVVRVYAVESSLPDLEENQDMSKIFIDEDILLDILRKNLQGDPTEILLGSAFAKWQPYEVQPAYPIWIIDTPGGVAFLVILCILALAGLIAMFVLLAKKYHWRCHKYKPRITPRTVHPVGNENQFKLNYIPDHSSQPPHYITDKKSLGDTYAGIFPSTAAIEAEPLPEKAGSTGPSISPPTVHPVGDENNFKLNYIPDHSSQPPYYIPDKKSLGDIPDHSSQPPYYIPDKKSLGDTHAGIFPSTEAIEAEPLPEKAGSTGPIRSWMSSPVDNDRNLTPVQTPDSSSRGSRPAPRGHGGQAA